jgi:hypothetical protein
MKEEKKKKRTPHPDTHLSRYPTPSPPRSIPLVGVVVVVVVVAAL